VSAILVLVDIWFQKHGADVVIRDVTLLERVLGAGAVVWFYLGKALWPAHLVFVYPEWHIHAADPRWWIPAVAAGCTTAVLWRSRGPCSRPALYAWLFFCVGLAPVMGFADISFMRYSLVADHYQHLAIIGIVSLLAAGWGWWQERASSPAFPRVAAVAVVLGLSVLTARQCGDYRDSRTLYEAILRKNPEAWIAHTNLGLILVSEGRVEEAMDHYRTALRLKPDLGDADNDLGIALAGIGRTQEGLAYLEKAAVLKPGSWEVRFNLGLALLNAGRPRDSIVHLEAAIQLKPEAVQAELDLGNALVAVGRPQDAIRHYERVVEVWPESTEARDDLGTALAQSGDLSRAVVEFAVAARLQPENAAIHNNLGCALAQLGRVAEARRQFVEALRIKPGDSEVRTNLGRLGPP
jgi:Flp pilus assembly protein TadD